MKQSFSYMHYSFILFALLTFFILILSGNFAFAASTGLPWEGPLAKIQESITGPIAYSISIMGIVVAGGLLIFGGELGDFVKKLIMLVLVIGMLVFSAQILSTLFGTNSALI